MRRKENTEKAMNVELTGALVVKNENTKEIVAVRESDD